jgi:outer membrane protein assembly factor BamE (lipoprotein component of BamABCDE complex)
MRMVTAILLSAALTFLLYFFCSDAVPKAKFDQVAIGMTQFQVESLLGFPHQVRHDKPGSTRFFYGGFQRMQWCTMDVCFGEDDRVTSKFHDH